MHAKFTSRRPLFLSIALAAMLAGCGGSGGDDDPSPPPPPPPPPPPGSTAPYEIGGTVSGLSGTVVLRESTSGDSIAVTSNGAFEFPEEAAQGASYAVAVYKQPAGQTCSVTSGSGNATADVTGITVACGNEPFAVSGTATGITEPVVVQLNLADNVTVSADGAFAFTRPLASGAAYAVSIVPDADATQSCAVTNGSGTISASVTNVAITCTPLAANVAVGGSIQGLSGQPVTLALNTTGIPPTHTTSTNGAFQFASTLPLNTAYRVSVDTHPTGQYCVVNNAGGVVSAISSSAVTVLCTTGALPTAFTVGGTVTGLTGTLQLALNKDNAPLTVSPSGASTSFTFPVSIPTNTDFRVTVADQPDDQTCIVTNGGTIMGAANVTTVSVACVNNDTDSLSGTFTRYGADVALTFYPDGIYVYGSVEQSAACGASQGNGVEVGAYDYNASAGTIEFISNVIDTNGATCGVWRNGTSIVDGSLSKTGSGQHQVLVISGGGMTPPNVLVPVASVPGTPIGSFTNGTLSFTLFTPEGRYLETNAVDDPARSYPAGIEAGCYTRTGTSNGQITVATTGCTGAVDTDGGSGLSALNGGPLNYQAVGNYAVDFNGGRYYGYRIVPGT
jgi:hypothetical protein